MRAVFAAVLVLLPLAATAARADTERGLRFSERRAQAQVTEDLENDQRRPLAVKALDAMLGFAADRLQDEGRYMDAARLRNEWRGHYRGVIAGDVVAEDVGDHLPYSNWLAAWYALLEAEFGVEYMEWSHLRDIWVLNFTLPVVFNPTAAETWCVEQLADNPGDTCKAEYARHFVGTKYGPTDPFNTAALHHGFSGVVAYWTTWTACEVATYGGGWFLICAPAATVVEIAIEKYVALRVSDRIWDRYNGG